MDQVLVAVKLGLASPGLTMCELMPLLLWFLPYTLEVAWAAVTLWPEAAHFLVQKIYLCPVLLVS